MSVTLTLEPGGPEDRTAQTPEINLANANFRHLMIALGYEVAEMDWVGRLEPRDLLARVARCQLAIAQGQGDEFTRTTVDHHEAGGPRVVDFGVDVAYVVRRLAALASEAVARGVAIRYA